MRTGMVFKKNGNICSPKGFEASGISCGLKRNGKRDLAVLVSGKDAQVAAAFTTNKFAAAPVEFCRRALRKSRSFRAVVVNSGNANACTGAAGMKNAEQMGRLAAEALKIDASEILVCSTGRIGVQLPMRKIAAGIGAAAKSLSPKNGALAAEAIMTTDLVKKECALTFDAGGTTICIGAMTKGSGMIAPLMHAAPHATMLCFMTTDAAIENSFLQECFAKAVKQTFNRITVDGDMSTNDTVILMANGMAGNKTIRKGTGAAAEFAECLYKAMERMAKAIVLDGEGVTKFVTVKADNATTVEDAELCAKAVANSLLCKTAWFGGDPNWGRVVAAAGYSGARFNPSKVSLYYDGTPVIVKGLDAGTPEKKLAEIVAGKEFTILLDLGAGKHSAEIWTNDISYQYVKINADYHT